MIIVLAAKKDHIGLVVTAAGYAAAAERVADFGTGSLIFRASPTHAAAELWLA